MSPSDQNSSPDRTADQKLTPPPGRPAPEPPSTEEPTTPREPLPAPPDQHEEPPRTPTGVVADPDPDSVGQQGSYLTTKQGARLRETDHSLKAGRRGPVLLQDHHLREKISHFDHERIPERVVHARGAAAHGVFVGYGTADSATSAGFLAEGKETPVFVRFSTVLGSRGSADTVRDTRGFATKFYTDEGTFDLVGNNIPVFFIQDAIKFPDIIHAGKPHPDREIPQAQSAHDTFWDFVSLHTEAQHHTIWNMSDRGIPRSYRMMEGFGIHTFRLVNAAGETSLAKFHWKPKLGVHSLTWEEAQLINGNDPDFHRRDLADAIESGAYPEWDLGIQVFPDNEEQTFEGIDLLDPTKIVPEELAPVQPIGRLTLNRNPRNYFAETEQVAYNPAHLVPGIDVTDDPLLQGRLFSYVDTQITRLGGPNDGQIPINRPHAPVNDMLRDGYGQQADHPGVAPYHPNSLDGGNPFPAGEDVRAFTDLPVKVSEGTKERKAPVSYEDHYSQVRLFWASMTPVEKEHIIGAYAFELAKCYEPTIRRRQLQSLAEIDETLCREVATALGEEAPAPRGTVEGAVELEASPALSQIGGTWPLDGRKIAIVVDPETAGPELAELHEAIASASMVPVIVAPTGGEVAGVPVSHTFAAARSVEFDAVLLAGAPAPAADAIPAREAKAGARGAGTLDPRVRLLLDEAWRHAKALGAWGPGREALEAEGYAADDAGVVAAEGWSDALGQLKEAMAAHRVWERFPTRV
ncbi:catalase [Rothia sp. AR01]|uniref:Catalase n=1 Tax=Rothia santali TaxID=2949643 RepID=A0A9X2HFA3_9MICC|nr:catalase [Rothia santali]MCP3426214.1 catalase [Rothia santali]